MDMEHSVKAKKKRSFATLRSVAPRPQLEDEERFA